MNREVPVSVQGAGFNKQEMVTVRTLGGQPSDVLRRLAVAVERLGLRVVDDDPVLVAKRPATGWGESGWDNDILANPATLTVNVRSLGPNACRATFTYVIDVPLVLRSDQRVIAREVDAIVTLASSAAAPRECASCGAPPSGRGVRFCRACGAPLDDERTSEVEALRSLAAVNAAYTSLRIGTTASAVAIVVLAALAYYFTWLATATDTGSLFLLVLVTIVGLTGVGALAMGAGRLGRLLRDGGDEPERRRDLSPTLSEDDVKMLAEPQQPLSVTEATTDLLEARPVPRRHDTGS